MSPIWPPPSYLGKYTLSIVYAKTHMSTRAQSFLCFTQIKAKRRQESPTESYLPPKFLHTPPISQSVLFHCEEENERVGAGRKKGWEEEKKGEREDKGTGRHFTIPFGKLRHAFLSLPFFPLIFFIRCI